MGPASYPMALSCIASADGSRRTRHLTQRLARGASAEDSIRDGPSVLPDGSLVLLRQRIGWRRAQVLAWWLVRTGPLWRIVRRIR